MNELLTLVIPTHERQALLKKSLTYYAGLGFPVIVVDSSAQAFSEIGLFPNVQYVHCPGAAFPHKLRTPVNTLVKTPFMFCCADDMYMAPETLRLCLEFLERNPDYSSAQGLYFGLAMNNDRSTLRAMYLGVDNFDNEVDGETPQERMLQLYCRYIPTFYAVFRTRCWQEQLTRLPDTIRNYCLAEFYLALTTAIFGKHKLLRETYALTYLAPTVGGLDPVCRNDLHELATMPRYAKEYAAFQGSVLAYLQELEPVDSRRGLLTIAKAVALQAWKPKPLLTPMEKLQREFMTFLTKLFHRAELRRRRKARREQDLRAIEDERDAMLNLLSPASRALLERLIDTVTGY